MSAHETVYSARIAYPDYLERARAQTVSLELYRSGAIAAPSSGTFTLYDTGTTVLVTGAVTVASSIATYPVLAATLPSTLALGPGYREEWALVLPDGTTRTYSRDAHLVRYAAHPVIGDTDIEAVYSDLARQRQAGTASWQGYIDEAWKRILGRLESQGVFPDHILTSWSLREVHLELVLHLIMLDFGSHGGGKWIELAASHKKDFELRWRGLKFRRASTEDGTMDDDSLHGAYCGVTLINRAPGTSWGGGFGL